MGPCIRYNSSRGGYGVDSLRKTTNRETRRRLIARNVAQIACQVGLNRMNRRCAAALALVGWYLMSPLIDYDNGKVLVDAPLKFWTQEGSFDTAAECNAARKKDFAFMMALEQKDAVKSEAERDRDDSRADAEFKWKPGTAKRNRGIGLRVAEDAKCIASDDPRLKEK